MVHRAILCLVYGLLVATASAQQESSLEKAAQWPQWRGPLGTGVAPQADPPIEWSDTKNLRWRAQLPGVGHSTPIVWGDRIYVTSAIATGPEVEPQPDTAPGAHDNAPVTHRHQFVVLALDRADGRIVWQRQVREELPHEGGHYTGTLINNSPATDGQRVYAFFGSRGLHCLDREGQILWSKDLGRMQSKHAHGEGSSPVLHGETLVINWDHEGQSFLLALDKRTGQQRWKTLRDEVTSWASPIVVEHQGQTQVVVSGTDRVRGYDLETGQVIWECGGLSQNIVASPVAGDGMVFAGSSYDKQALLAINLQGARGDITGTPQLAWSRIRGTPYVPSPLLYGNSLYFLRHYQAILSRVDTKTGQDQYGPFRLEGLRNIYSSPVAAAGRVYVTDLDGMTMVLTHDDNPRPLAQNWLNDQFAASAAVVGDQLLLRGTKFLYCIGGDSTSGKPSTASRSGNPKQ